MAKIATNPTKLVSGIGINNVSYKVRENGIFCPFYLRWSKMIDRCYSQEKERYADCQVCGEWLVFSNFKTWMEKQDWEGKQLDKDIICPGNRTYSPETCCFVQADINMLFHRKRVSKYGTGISKKEGENGYNATFAHRRNKYYIGYFDSIQNAEKARRMFKAEYLENKIIPEINDLVIVDGIRKHINILRELKND